MSDWMDIHALADNQLDGDAKARAEASLNEPRLRAEYEAVQNLKQLLREKAQPISCRETWAKCRDRLGELDKRRNVETFVGRYAWGLCTVFLALIIGAGIFNRAFVGSGIGTGDAARMMSGLAPVSRSVSPAVEMKSWIKPKPQKQIRLVSTAVGHFQGHPVVLYNLVDPEGKLSVLEVQGVTRVEGVEPMIDGQEYSVGKLNGTNCVTWSEPYGTAFLMADRPYENLAEVAAELREE